ncbi:DUF397 domain-containing protein [Streptomyces sp. NPDC050528]|uniref:DUF397 domain-containing protein n=1 Tax=Streptomyces sp. NPDC050528 TaxID=3365623 RepID=UPI0037B2D3C2
MNTPELHWFKSSYSDSGDINDCVEVAVAPAVIHVRDSKCTGVGVGDAHLTVGMATWADFLTHISAAR